jgi:hypothetical protein
MAKVKTVAKKAGGRGGRKVASGPGKVKSKAKRVRKPRAPRAAKKDTTEPVVPPPTVAATVPAAPAAIEHGQRPETLDHHVNEPMSGVGDDNPPAGTPVPPAEKTPGDVSGS